MERNVIIGTRKSDLALWQANFIKDKLSVLGINSALKFISTQGDRVADLNLSKLDGQGFFTKELEQALLTKVIDLAVHSYKDVPTLSVPGLHIAAVSERADPAEVLLISKSSVAITQNLSLKFGSTVGTSSSRRKAQLLAIRPDLKVQDLRGNITTRISKLRRGGYDAIMLAKAGIKRLDLDVGDFHVEELKPTYLIPAPAQGALCVQIREDDQDLYRALQGIHHPDVADLVNFERKVLQLFGGGCSLPVGCYCQKNQDTFQVFISKATSALSFPDRLTLNTPKLDGLAEHILVKFDARRNMPKSLFISCSLSEQSYFRRAVVRHGIQIVARPLVRTIPLLTELNAAITQSIDWLFFTSKNGIKHFFQLHPNLPKNIKFAVIGRGSEATLRSYGYRADYVGDHIDTAQVGKQFATLAKGTKILFPSAKDSVKNIQHNLELAHIETIHLPIYKTVPEKNVQPSFEEILIFTSPSNAAAYFANNSLLANQQVIGMGASTGKKLAEFHIKYTLPLSSDEMGLADAVFGL